MARPKKRAKRGAVKVEVRAGVLYLRCTVDGTRHTFSLNTPDSPANRHEAAKIANLIEGDKLRGEFDPTYQRYRGQKEQATPTHGTTLATLWPKWVEHRRTAENLTPQTVNTRYKTNGNKLKHYRSDIRTEEQARKFIKSLAETQGPATLNRSLESYQKFTQWALSKGYIDLDPFANLERVKVAKSLPRKPFSLDEIGRILSEFKTHPDYFCYHDFVANFLGLGLRPSEVIGLQWKRVDFDLGTIDICDSLGRGENGESSGHQRIRRKTKTGHSVVRRLSPQLLTILQGRHTPECKPDDLIFAVGGTAIDDREFLKGPWKKTLKLAGVPYRPPYTLRHTMASHAIAQGTPSTDVAKMLGHNSLRMVNEIYAHSITNLPKPPEMGI